MGNTHWLTKEIKTLSQNSKKYTYNELQSLLPMRTVSGIQYKARCLKLKKKEKWSKSELDLLKKHYEHELLFELSKLFPDRTPYSISHKAQRLGLKKTEEAHNTVMKKLWVGGIKPRTWSKIEKQKLTEVYPCCTKEEIIPLFPNHTYHAIMAYAHLLGLHKNKEILGKQASQNCTNKRLWRYVRSTTPTKPERRIMEIISKYKFPFKYVGDNSIIIYGLNPDFINVDGKKQIIEVFGRVFHDPNKSFMMIKPQRQEKIRKKIYASVGYNCLIFWDDEMKRLSDEEIAKKINEFMG